MRMNSGKLEIIVTKFRALIRPLLAWSNQYQDGLKEGLQDVDDLLQMVLVQELDGQGQPLLAAEDADMVLKGASSNLETIIKEMEQILRQCQLTHLSHCSMRTWKGVGHTVRFLDSALQNFQDEVEKTAFISSAKKDILDICDELKLMNDMFWLINSSPGTMNVITCLDVSFIIEKIGVEISCMLYNWIVGNMDNAELVCSLQEDIYGLQKKVRGYYEIICRTRLFGKYTNAPKLDEHVVCFVNFLIEEMSKLLLSQSGATASSSFVIASEIEMLVQEFVILRCSLLNVLILYLQEEKERDSLLMEGMNSLCVSMRNLIMDTGFLVYFFRLDLRGKRGNQRAERGASYTLHTNKEEDKKESAKNWRFHLDCLLQDVASLKQQANDLFHSSNEDFSSSGNTFSSKNQMGSASFLSMNLEKLIQSDAASNATLNDQIQTIYQETLSLGKFLDGISADDQLVKSSLEIRLLRQKFVQVQNMSIFIIDLILHGKGPIWYHKLGVYVIQNLIKAVQRKMKAYLRNFVSSDSIATSVSGIASSLAESHTWNVMEVSFKDKFKDMKSEESPDKLVGIRDATMQVIELLTSIKATRLTTLSIVGMPGLGKTTLANSVYEHPSVTIHFHVRAWCCASQFYIKEALLSEILYQIVGKANASQQMIGEDLALKLYQTLKGMKYLIVIDDIWDVGLWNDLKESFPDDHNGSRILFTTQSHAVAFEINSIPYALRLLSDETSCELLLLHVFDRGSCPVELSMISKHIAKKCKGLPLAVVLTAGILKRTERRKDSWEQVAKSVFGFCRKREKYCEIKDVTNIVKFSYKQLPDCLKRCFYYFGAFPVDTSISVSKLTRLWISEGLVQGPKLGQKSLKQEAETYLHELIDRSLVMITKKSSQGGIKECRVHNVLRQFCTEILRSKWHVLEEEVFDRFSSFHHTPFHPPFPHTPFHHTTYLFHYRSYPAIKFSRFQFRDVSYGSHFRPRLGYTENNVFGYEPNVVRGVNSDGRLLMRTPTNQSKLFDYGLISKFSLLRVLDLGNVRFESSADTSDIVMIAKLIHLRYLAIRLRRNKLPPEIGNLQNLETLAVSGVIGMIMLPWSIKNFASLRHLLSDHGIFIFPQSFIELQYSDIHFPLFDNLTSISALPLKRGNKVENLILRRIPGIRKLGCRFFSDAWDISTGCSIFPELVFLNELESLKITFSGKVVCPCRFSFPSNLTKLSISSSHLPWEEISVIAQLVPNLQALKLLSKAFEGPKWETREDDEFPKLKFLKLESLDVEEWESFAPNHLPVLEQLMVLHCPQLKEIPSSFGDIATLKSIELKGCSSSARDSVKRILEYQRDMSNDELQVTLGSPA